MTTSRNATPVAPKVPRSAQDQSRRPASLREVELDLREDMRAGREPFSRIMAAVAQLGDGETLVLRTIFEPVPLFALMTKRGFSHEVARHADDDWTVWFRRATPDSVSQDAASHEALPPAEVEAADPTTVWLDVRGLEPPEPLARTLAALETLPAGHQLVQTNAQVPQFLLPMLAERGFACEIDESHVDRVLVRIWRPERD